MKKTTLFILLVSLVIMFFTGCNQSDIKDGKLTVTDSLGNEVVIEKTPERIVAMLASDVEILYALGVEDKIIAVGEYANYPEDTANKQKVGTSINTNIEELIALEPDVVFIGVMGQTEDHYEQLKQAGIPVVVSNAQTIKDTYNIIEIIGQVVGKHQEAKDMVKDMKAGFDELKEKSINKEALNAYIEVSPLQFGLWTCGKGTFIQELLDIVNINNVFDDLEGWAEVSEEQVIDRNPDIILTTVGVSYGVEKPVEDILSRENWKSVKAVADEKIYMLDSDKTARPGPRLLEAARELFDAVHGN